MAEEFKNNVPEHETPKISSTEESSAEVKDGGLFDFLGKKKEEVKPQETPLEEVKENKHTLLEKLQGKTEEDEQNKPSLIEKLHRSSSSSSDEEGEKKKKFVEGEEEKKGVMENIKEKLPGHGKKPEDSPVVNTTPLVETATPITEHSAEKKGILEKIKEKLPGSHEKTNGEEDKAVKESA